MGERAVYYIGVSHARPNQALARATEQTMPEHCHAPNITSYKNNLIKLNPNF